MKRLLKNLIIPVLASRPVSSLATSLFGRGIPVFMLHRMADKDQRCRGTTPQHLRQCLSYLRENQYTFISLETLIRSLNQQEPLPEKTIVFTMDDGFQDQAKIAAPIFLEFDCPLTFFVITGMLDQTLWPWDAKTSWIIDNTQKKSLPVQLHDETLHIQLNETGNRHQARETVRNLLKEVAAADVSAIVHQLAEVAEVKLPVNPPSTYQPLNWGDARELENKGIQFAPHSMSHQILSKLDRESCAQEILGSWASLQKEMEKPLNVFCYPTGRVLDFGPREIDILKQAGFIGAVATSPGYIDMEQDYKQQVFRIPRFELPDNMADFIQYCSWIEYAKHPNRHNT